MRTARLCRRTGEEVTSVQDTLCLFSLFPFTWRWKTRFKPDPKRPSQDPTQYTEHGQTDTHLAFLCHNVKASPQASVIFAPLTNDKSGCRPAGNDWSSSVPENIHQAAQRKDRGAEGRKGIRQASRIAQVGNPYDGERTLQKYSMQETGWCINLTCWEGARAAPVSIQRLTENLHPRK